MKKRILNITIFTIFIFIISAWAYGLETISINNIKPGMVGIGKTVFKGVEIEEFKVKVINIIKDKSGNDYIFIELNDERFKKYGTIIAGMSGSPIYFDNKLAGAIAYGWKFTKGPYGLVVPIGRMLKIKRDFFAFKDLRNRVSYISVSGIGDRAYSYLEKAFSSYGLKTLKTGSFNAGLSRGESLKPGSAVSLGLTIGDLSIASIGTLTYRDKNFFLAFGHPFLRKGSVDYFFSSAYVYGIVPNTEFPFKLAAPMDIVGKVSQDRGEGIGGYFGQYPKVISIIVSVEDEDTKKMRTFRIKSIRDEDLFPLILLVSVLNSIDESINRVGKGTSVFSISFNRGGKSIVKLRDMYWSGEDIASQSLSALKDLIYELENNPFERIEFDEVKVEIKITSEKKVGYIHSIVLDKDQYKPGELIRGRVRIKPYRKPFFEEKVAIRIPDDFPYGTFYLLVRGGDINLPLDMKNLEEKPDNLEEFLKDLTNRERNNSLVLELYSESFIDTLKDQSKKPTLDQLFQDLEVKKVKRIFNMDMILGDWVEKEIFITSGERREEK